MSTHKITRDRQNPRQKSEFDQLRILMLFSFAFSDKMMKALAKCATISEKKQTIKNVIDECIKENILKDFLKEHRREVEMSSYWEYDSGRIR